MTPQSRPTLAAADEIAASLASIDAIPCSVLPKGPHRSFLRIAAAAGRDVYAYHAGPSDAGVWNVWLVNQRIPVEQLVTQPTLHWLSQMEEARRA